MSEILVSEEEEGSYRKPQLWIVPSEGEKDSHLRGSTRAMQRKTRGIDWFNDAEEYFRTVFRKKMQENVQNKKDPAAYILHFKKHDAQERFRYIYESLSRIEEGVPGTLAGTTRAYGQIQHIFRVRLREVVFYKQENTRTQKTKGRGGAPRAQTIYLPGDEAATHDEYKDDEVIIYHPNGQFVAPQYNVYPHTYVLRHKVKDVDIFLPSSAITSSDLISQELLSTKEYALASRPLAKGHIIGLPDNPFTQYYALENRKPAILEEYS